MDASWSSNNAAKTPFSLLWLIPFHPGLRGHGHTETKQVQRKTDLEAKEKRIRRALIEKEVLVACAHPFVCNLYTAFQV